MTDFQEIVGFLVNKKTIHYGPKALSLVQSLGVSSDCEPVYRNVAKFMHCCDLGVSWTKLADAPTLFYMKEDNGVDEARTWEQWEKFGFKRIGGECEC